MIVLQRGKALADPFDILPGRLMFAALRQPGLPVLTFLLADLLIIELHIPLRRLLKASMADGVGGDPVH
ncbi:hypothetical protein D3C75_956730 [compost metagenome]